MSDIDLRCAPGVIPSHGTCFTLEQLVKIAYAYNKANTRPGSKAKMIEVIFDKEYLLRELHQRLAPVCGTSSTAQACWTEQQFVRALNDIDITDFTFRPNGPHGRFEWLSTTHIHNVMYQYARRFPHFVFLGAVPIDFDDLPSLGIRNLDLPHIRSRGVTQIGIVFNTDEHYKSGEHWICAFSCIPTRRVYYFDSVGRRPEKRISRYLARITRHIMLEQTVQLTDIDIRYNNQVHQRGNSECGVYVLNFLIRMLKGESFDEIVNARMSDREINRCRRRYFRNVV